MGMFDYVAVHVPLPDGRVLHEPVAELFADEAGPDPTLTAEDQRELDGIFTRMDRLFARVFKRRTQAADGGPRRP